jgi:hypothetical protein
MPNWKQLDRLELANMFRDIGAKIRHKQIDIGRPQYASSLGHGVIQAIHCGYDKIVAVELGVGQGQGLLELCKAAEYYRGEFEIDIQVFGFDNATGLPPFVGYKDHPEIWQAGQFKMANPDAIRSKLPEFGHLLIGDIGETVQDFETTIYGARLAFVSLDMDYYSSTVRAMPLFEMNPQSYVPALPVYVDDVDVLISYNPWCGAEVALQEFNETHEFRKFQKRPNYGIHNFYVCHILDHPVRTGKISPRLPFEIRGF